MNRIASLLPSATEIVCALGSEDSLMGRSHECDFPFAVRKLPILTSTSIPSKGSSQLIDQSVRSVLEKGLSLYQVDAELLRQLSPEVIITQLQCEVCAVSPEDVERALAEKTGLRPEIVSLQAHSIDSLWKDFRAVGAAIGRKGQAEELIGKLSNRIQAIREMTRNLEFRPKVLCVEWIEPFIPAGNWIPEMVEMSGGMAVIENPEVIIFMPCGFPIERSLSEIPKFLENPTIRLSSAVKNQKVFVADGNQYFNRPGPRLVESLEILAEILQPELFKFGHEGQGWIRFSASQKKMAPLGPFSLS